MPARRRLRRGGAREIELPGASVGEVVRELVARHPGLGGQVLTPEGALNRYVNVYLNGEDVRYLSGLDTPVGETDEVRLLPAMAGGRA